MRSSQRLILVAAIGGIISASQANAALEITKIIGAGDTLAGTGEVLTNVDDYAVDAAGRRWLTGTSGGYNAYWANVNGSWQRIMKTGDTVPDRPSQQFNFFGGGTLTGDGLYSFSASNPDSSPSIPDGSATWTWTASGGLQKLTRKLDPVPGLPTDVWLEPFGFGKANSNNYFSSTGRLVPGIGTTTSENDRVLMAGTVGSFQPIARNGETMPHEPTRTWSFPTVLAVTNDKIIGQSGNHLFNYNINTQTFSTLLQDGQTAPDSSAGKTINSIPSSSVAGFSDPIKIPLGRNKILVRTKVNLSGGGTEDVLYIGEPGNPSSFQRWATQGEIVTPTGGVARDWLPGDVNSSGLAVVSGIYTESGTKQALFVGTAGNYELLMKRLDPIVPGFSAKEFRNVSISEEGDVAFIARSNEDSNKFMLAFWDGNTVQKIVAYDDIGDFGLGSPHTVTDIRFYSGFTDPASLTFRLGFSSGESGWYSVAVPEPTSLALAALGGMSLLRRRRS